MSFTKARWNNKKIERHFKGKERALGKCMNFFWKCSTRRSKNAGTLCKTSIKSRCTDLHKQYHKQKNHRKHMKCWKSDISLFNEKWAQIKVSKIKFKMSWYFSWNSRISHLQHLICFLCSVDKWLVYEIFKSLGL